MIKLLHPSNSEAATGNSGPIEAANEEAIALFVNVTSLTGSVTVKVQESADGVDWFDVPGLTSGSLGSTGAVAVRATIGTKLSDKVRAVWTVVTGPATFTARLSTVDFQGSGN